MYNDYINEIRYINNIISESDHVTALQGKLLGAEYILSHTFISEVWNGGQTTRSVVYRNPLLIESER